MDERAGREHQVPVGAVPLGDQTTVLLHTAEGTNEARWPFDADVASRSVDRCDHRPLGVVVARFGLGVEDQLGEVARPSPRLARATTTDEIRHAAVGGNDLIGPGVLEVAAVVRLAVADDPVAAPFAAEAERESLPSLLA